MSKLGLLNGLCLLRILVVHDTPELSEFIVATLTTYDLETRHYETTAEVLEYFRTRTADLIIIDLGMVGRSPWQVIRRARETNDNMRVIALTYYPDNRERDTDILETVDHYLIKPFTVEELMAAVHMLIGSGTSS